MMNDHITFSISWLNKLLVLLLNTSGSGVKAGRFNPMYKLTNTAVDKEAIVLLQSVKEQIFHPTVRLKTVTEHTHSRVFLPLLIKLIRIIHLLPNDWDPVLHFHVISFVTIHASSFVTCIIAVYVKQKKDKKALACDYINPKIK